MSLLFFFFSESLFAAALLHEEIETDSNPAFSRHSGYKSNLMCLSLSSTLPALHTPSFVGVGPSTYFFFSFLLHVLLFKKKGRTTRGGREVKREKIKKQLKHHSQEKKLRKMGHKRLISLFDTCDDRESLLRPFLSILLIFPSTKLNSHHPNRN
jgi:hypothetical protein